MKLDQDFGPNTKFSAFWTNQSTNQIAAPDGLPIPLTASRPKIVGGNQYRFNLDRTISPTTLAHLGVGFYRFHNPDSAPESVLNYEILQGANLGLVGSATGVGFPAITGLGGNSQWKPWSQHSRPSDYRSRIDHRQPVHDARQT